MDSERATHAQLTDRQRQVLELIARGRTNFEVAQELGITLDGAKWHLREIMAKLGCDTREEAVAIWRGRPSAAERLIHRATKAFGLLPATAWKVGGLAAAGSIILAAAVLASATLGSGDGLTDDEAGAAGQSATGTASPPADSAIAFRSCGTTAFRRPAIAEMAGAFQLPRFSGSDGATSERPTPAYFSYYLSRVYQVFPRAVSANIQNVALSGVQHNENAPVLIPAANPCDSTLRQDYTLNYYEFWFIDMLPTAARLDGSVLTFEVDVLPGSMTDIVLPDPPIPMPETPTKNGFNGLPPFQELRVVGPSGELLYTRGAGGTAQYATDGSLAFASNAFGGSQIEFEVRDRAQSIVIYTQQAAGLGPVTIRDTTGGSWASGPREQAPNTWAEVFRGTLPAGTYRADAGVALIVPAGTPLP
jgi:DNA-binding CsgD family transcriptional regulator